MAHQKPAPRPINRRQFLGETAQMLAASSLIAMGLMGYGKHSHALPATALRPPGALPEEDFLGACIRCGLCVRSCPYNTLKLAQVGDDIATGTPYFIARDVPCEMCEDIPCIPACPTHALNHDLKKIDQAKMGLAQITDQSACIAFLGLRCEVCYNVCPVRGKAITLERQHNARSGKHALFIPVLHFDACTGCGKCEEACILEEAAIKVLPIALAKGKMQAHYKVGWQEKQQAGQALVTPDVEHQFNLPSGKRYDYYGEGLVDTPEEIAPPFANNPLDSLNQKQEP
jgi:ferredoxin-type protein NapG